MEKLSTMTADITAENEAKILELFPQVATEVEAEDGSIRQAIDFDALRDLLGDVAEGQRERYQFTWPGKRKAKEEARKPINKTLIPCPEKSVDWDTTENLYIEGDNLEALKILKETYAGKVKLIYIDPPYNTGHDFIYDDDFAQTNAEYAAESGEYDEEGRRLVANLENNGRFHSDWCSMIYPRLLLAREILSNDGVVFISIDDNEVKNLKNICDEIFGNKNFIAQIIHKNNSMKNQSKYVGVSTEYILVYCRDIAILTSSQPKWRVSKKGAAEINALYKKLRAQGLSLDEIHENILDMYARPKYAHLSRWNKVDENGVFKDADLSRSNGPKDYTIINPNTGKPCPVPSRGWGKSYEELLRLQKEDLIWYGDESTAPGQKSYLTEDSESVFDNFVFVDSSADKKEISQMFGAPVFEYPKPVELLSQLFSLCTSKNDIILDFFSGSASSAIATMRLNSKDALFRKFILVQINEKTNKESIAYKSGYKSIPEIAQKRIKITGQLLKKSDFVPDIGFRVLRIDSSNFKEVSAAPGEFEQASLFDFSDNLKEDRTSLDLLFQVLPKFRIEYSAKIEELDICGKHAFNVNDGQLIACFDLELGNDVIEEIAKMEPIYAVFRDASLKDDATAANLEELFKTFSPDTVRRVI